MNTVEILTRARAYVERGFCHNTWAKDKDGTVVMPESRDAVCWCIGGAVHAVIRKDDLCREDKDSALKALLSAKGHADKGAQTSIVITRLNDSMSQQEALEWIDAAVESLKVAA